MNSIDLRLQLNFAPGSDGLSKVETRPTFVLLQWVGGDVYEYSDELGGR